MFSFTDYGDRKSRYFDYFISESPELSNISMFLQFQINYDLQLAI